MAFKMTEEEYMKMRQGPPKPPAPKPPKRKLPKAAPQKKKKRYNPFKDGRTPTGASYTTGP